MMQARIFLLLVGSWMYWSFDTVQGQSVPGSETMEAEALEEVVQRFFDKLVGRQFDFVQTDLESREFRCESWVGANQDRRLFVQLPSSVDRNEMKVRISREYLLHADGMKIDQIYSDYLERSESSVPSLNGVRNWRNAVFLDSARAISLGFFWDGRCSRELMSNSDFWNDYQFAMQGHELVWKKTGIYPQIVFQFDKTGEEIRLSEMEVVFQSATTNEPNWMVQNIKHEFTGNRNALQGWTTTVLYSTREGPLTTVDHCIASNFESVDDGTRLTFERLAVRNGVEVRVRDEPGPRFEFRSGRFELVLDKDAVSEINRLLDESPDRQPSSPDTSMMATSRYLRSQSTAAHCGVYSFAAAAASLGRQIAIDEILQQADMATRKGASIDGILRTAKRYSLFARPVVNADFEMLKRLKSPALLHFGGSFQAEGTAHWVAFLGIDEFGKAKIVDLPRGESAVEPANLLTEWDGICVVLSRGEIRQPAVVWARWSHWVLPLLGLVVLLGSLAHRFHNPKSKKLQIASLSALVVTTTCLWLVFSNNSYIANELALRLTLSKQPRDHDVPITSDIEVLEEVALKNAVVDCRLPNAYHLGHVPRSVNLPVDASLSETRSALKQLEGYGQISVYCQSKNCSWSRKKANYLRSLGFANVVVYEPGWLGYIQSRRERDE